MRRATTILLGILLGAIAAGLGIGFFLKMANDDRARLAEQVQETVRAATKAREENSQAIQDANIKLNASNQEVAKAQAMIKALQEERDLLAHAETLPVPSAKTVRGWSDTINVGLGVSIKLPPDATVSANSARELGVTRGDDDALWLSVTPYLEKNDREYRSSLATSTAVSYLANSRLLTGYVGERFGYNEALLVLRAQQSGTSTHLVWVRLPSSKKADIDAILPILAGLHFE
ncbi:MAG: hypothetical protein WC787_02245 [Patescibacteria group bacterium]|jgi:hypothetical protein